MRDVQPIEIIGGGLAGLAAGLALRRSGVPVTVFEAGDYPRHRVCGEFISGLDPETVRTLGLGDLLAGAVANTSVTYHVRDKVLGPFPLPATAWGISRHTLDARAARAFQEAGGILKARTRAPDDAAKPGRVLANGRRRTGTFWVGLKVHAYQLALGSDLEVHLGDRAYVGLSRIESAGVNICGIFFRRATDQRGPGLLLAYLEGCGLGALAERLRAARVDPNSFCVTAASLGSPGCAEADTVRIGDALASIPPYTGNGLAMALQSAESAVGPLEAYARGTSHWSDCVRSVARAQRGRFRRRLAVAAFLHPCLLYRRRQACLSLLAGSGLLPFRTLYSALH
jgi:2-polyprenyl-6-methoxyphenol hydroxylase-like FAD-dependent oxidoreductase